MVGMAASEQQAYLLLTFAPSPLFTIHPGFVIISCKHGQEYNRQQMRIIMRMNFLLRRKYMGDKKSSIQRSKIKG